MKYQFIDNTEYGLPRMIKALVEKAFNMAGVTAKEPVVINDYDVKRVYLTVDGVDHTIRVWSERETEKCVYIRISLFSDDSGYDLLSSVTMRFSKADYPNENEPVKKVKQMKYQVYLLKDRAAKAKHPEGKQGLHRQNGVDSIDERQYNKVYEGSIQVPGKYTHEQTLDKIFKLLNINKPADYTYPSLSVGDVVVLRDTAYYCEGMGWSWHLWHGIDDDMDVTVKNLREYMKQEKPEVLRVEFSNAPVENADGSFTFERDGKGGWNEYTVKDHDDVVATMLADIEKHGVTRIICNMMGSGWMQNDKRYGRPVKQVDIELLADGWKRELMHFRSDEELAKDRARLKAEGLIK